MKAKNESKQANKNVNNYFENVKTLAEAKKLWKKLSLELHPDKNGGNDTEFKTMENQYDVFCKKLEHAARMEELEKRAYVLDSGDIDAVKHANKVISNEFKEFRRTLEVNLMILREQYNAMNETRKAFDYLARVTSTPVEKFFDVDFIKKLYKPYSFSVKETGGVHTCFAEMRKKSEKTDFDKLEERILNNVGEALNIRETLDTSKGTYYVPVYNFTPSNILKYLQKLDTYVFSVNQYKAKKREEARKAKKQAKKQREQAARNAYEQATENAAA